MVLGQQFRLGIAGSNGHLALRSPGPSGTPIAGSNTGWWIATNGCRGRTGMLDNRPTGRASGGSRAVQVSGLRATAPLVLIPLAGTVLYLIIAGGSRYGLMLSSSVQQSSNSAEGLLCCLRGPADVLAPGLIGLGNADRWLGGGPDLVLSALMLIGCLSWPRGSPCRPMVLGGLAAVLGGYGMTYGVRNVFGTHWLMEVQRYHLFPQFGFVLIVAAVARPWLEQFECAATISPCGCDGIRRSASANQPTVAECPIAGLQISRPGGDASRILDRLDQVCRDHGIMRDQALLAFGPVRPRWFPHDSNALVMLADSVKIPSLSADQARFRTDDFAVCDRGRSTVRRHGCLRILQSSGQPRGADPIAGCRLVGESGFSSLGPGRWQAERGPAYLEFRLDDPANRSALGPAGWLCVPGSESAEKIEVWWTGRGGFWSEARSVHWRPVLEGVSRERSVPLGRLPHWSPAHLTHIRVWDGRTTHHPRDSAFVA